MVSFCPSLDIRLTAPRSSSDHIWALPALPKARVPGTQTGKPLLLDGRRLLGLRDKLGDDCQQGKYMETLLSWVLCFPLTPSCLFAGLPVSSLDSGYQNCKERPI